MYAHKVHINPFALLILVWFLCTLISWVKKSNLSVPYAVSLLIVVTEILKVASHQKHLCSEYFLNNKALKLFCPELFQNVKRKVILPL